jgi:hypothetical protein
MAIFAVWAGAVAAKTESATKVARLFVNAVLPRHSTRTAERYVAQSTPVAHARGIYNAILSEQLARMRIAGHGC